MNVISSGSLEQQISSAVGHLQYAISVAQELSIDNFGIFSGNASALVCTDWDDLAKVTKELKIELQRLEILP